MAAVEGRKGSGHYKLADPKKAPADGEVAKPTAVKKTTALKSKNKSIAVKRLSVGSAGGAAAKLKKAKTATKAPALASKKPKKATPATEAAADKAKLTVKPKKSAEAAAPKKATALKKSAATKKSDHNDAVTDDKKPAKKNAKKEKA